MKSVGLVLLVLNLSTPIEIILERIERRVSQPHFTIQTTISCRPFLSNQFSSQAK